MVDGSRSSCRRYFANRVNSLSVISDLFRKAIASQLFLSIVAGGDGDGKIWDAPKSTARGFIRKPRAVGLILFSSSTRWAGC